MTEDKVINTIQEQDNPFFSITHNKELDCYDMILKKSSYETEKELVGILSFVHQTGLYCPESNLRIGIEEEPKIKVKKPKIITNA
jgi:hypothetical protein